MQKIRLTKPNEFMKNILIIGSTGQIGSELTMKLRGMYNGNIVAGYIPGAEPNETIRESGPCAIVDITNELYTIWQHYFQPLRKRNHSLHGK